MFLRLNNEQNRKELRSTMADNHVMFRRDKVKSKTPVRDLMKEYFRDEKTAYKYDNGVRNIDTSKTKDNVAIIKPPENFDRIRRERINQLSEERKKKGQRAMRSDTVDLIETVIQADREMLKKMTREEQIKFYKTCIEVMQEDEKTYGKIDAAVIHFDETTTHAQVLSSTLDFENHKSRAKEMIGNRVKMSVDQTEFVHAVQNKGYTYVTRGKNRVEENYRERKKEQEEKFKVKINRHNEHIIDEIEKDKQSIKGIKKDVVDGLVRDYPKMKIVRNKKTHEMSESFESKAMQEELHSYSLENVLLLKNQLDEYTRKQREKELKEREEKLKQQEEEQKRKDDELNSRENQLEERERRLSISEYKVQQDEQDAQNMLDFVNSKALEIDEKLNRREEQINENAKQLSNAYKGTKKYLYYKHIYNKATKSWSDEKRERYYDSWLRKKQFWLVDSKDYIAEDRLRKGMKREAGVNDNNNLYVEQNKEKDDKHFDPMDD